MDFIRPAATVVEYVQSELNGRARYKQEAFWKACSYGQTDKVRKLIADGVNLNWVSHTYNSCAIHVASHGNADIVKLLLAAGCDVGLVDDRGNLALHHAAMKGRSEILGLLLDAGSSTDARNFNGWTALHCAAYWCHLGCVQVLIEKGCSINTRNKEGRSALHEACRSPVNSGEVRLASIVQQLLTAGADLHARRISSDDLQLEADFNPLMYAAYHGQYDAAKALIDAKCDVNLQSHNGWTALHWASDRGFPNIVRLLLNSGADSCIETQQEHTAIDRAQSVEIRNLFFSAHTSSTDENCCDINDNAEVEAHEGISMATGAGGRKDNTDIVDSLVQDGAKVNGVTWTTGNTDEDLELGDIREKGLDD